LTDEWYEWLDWRDPSRPFFGFLYYDAVVSTDVPANYPPVVPVPPGAPTQVRLFARYLAAVHYDDALIGRVLDDLERRRLLDSTVIIVTSDHGMEFNENGLGFTGHGTSYSDVQVHTPLVVRWPGRPPERISRRTSHNDVAPTLLAELFGCVNPPSDYASGHSLFSDKEWNWLISASYADFALIEPDRVTVVFPSGYEIRDRSYRLVPNPTLPRDSLRAAMHEMGRFYR
jgi:membrane-anchored protein YejM (alkaline phosphatase superfamily)